MLITQLYPLLADELIRAAELQFDLNQLFTTINTLDKDNLSRPGSVFAWGSTKLDELIDPDGVWNDGTDLQVAVTKGYMKAGIVSAVSSYFPAASGVWHKHDNKALLDSVSGVSGSNRCVITNLTGDSYTITPDEKDALDAASAPSGANPIATMDDLDAFADLDPIEFYSYGWIVDLDNGNYLYCNDDIDLSGDRRDFSASLRARLYQFAIPPNDAEGTGSVHVVWDGTNMVLFLPVSLGSLTMSDTSEEPTWYQNLVDNTPVEIGDIIDPTGPTVRGHIVVKKITGEAKIQIGMINEWALAGTVNAKVDAFGFISKP